ncbi:MAG: hypothetical protein ACFFEE_02475 [Candidatus Thorarchaeota archaeon]
MLFDNEIQQLILNLSAEIVRTARESFKESGKRRSSFWLYDEFDTPQDLEGKIDGFGSMDRKIQTSNIEWDYWSRISD